MSHNLFLRISRNRARDHRLSLSQFRIARIGKFVHCSLVGAPIWVMAARKVGFSVATTWFISAWIGFIFFIFSKLWHSIDTLWAVVCFGTRFMYQADDLARPQHSELGLFFEPLEARISYIPLSPTQNKCFLLSKYWSSIWNRWLHGVYIQCWLCTTATRLSGVDESFIQANVRLFCAHCSMSDNLAHFA